jgi:hypothetical protein
MKDKLVKILNKSVAQLQQGPPDPPPDWEDLPYGVCCMVNLRCKSIHDGKDGPLTSSKKCCSCHPGTQEWACDRSKWCNRYHVTDPRYDSGWRLCKKTSWHPYPASCARVGCEPSLPGNGGQCDKVGNS